MKFLQSAHMIPSLGSLFYLLEKLGFEEIFLEDMPVKICIFSHLYILQIFCIASYTKNWSNFRMLSTRLSLAPKKDIF